WLLTGSADGTAGLWRLQAKELVTIACRSAGRNLTEEEWQQYFRGQAYRPTCDLLPLEPSVSSARLDQSAGTNQGEK
ncbi:MAG: hypothetical protein ACK2UY_14015, partial [Anaerolineae bacterium]